jgi:hypothetical protein
MTQQIQNLGQPAAPYSPPPVPQPRSPYTAPEPRYGPPPQQPQPQYGQPQPQPQPQPQYGPPPAQYGPPAQQFGGPQPPAGPPAPPYGYGQPAAPAPRKSRTGLVVGIVVGVVVLAGLAVGAVFLFGSKSLDTAKAQTKIAELTKQQIGITPTDVSCPADVDLKSGTTFQCTAKLDGQAISYTVKETDDKGNVRVDSDNNLVLVSKVEESLGKQVGDQAGVQATATCDTGGKKVLVDSADKPISCTVTNAEDSSDTLDVQATVDSDGNVSWTS